MRKIDLPDGWHRIPGTHPVWPDALPHGGDHWIFAWVFVESGQIDRASGYCFKEIEGYDTIARIRNYGSKVFEIQTNPVMKSLQRELLQTILKNSNATSIYDLMKPPIDEWADDFQVFT